MKSYVAVARLNLDGSPDRGFGVDGVARIDSNDYEYIYDIAIQPDGRIVVAGDKYEGKNGSCAVNADGSPDMGFGPTAAAITPSTSGCAASPSS